MSFWKRTGQNDNSRPAELRPWLANAILRSVGQRSGDGTDSQEWQCARAPAFVLMFGARRRRERRAAGRNRA
jgi:hypothetical protein